MTRAYIGLILVCFLTLSSLRGADSVAISVRTVSLAHDFSGQPIPRFANKFFASTDAKRGRVQVWDANSTSVANYALQLPGVASVVISSIAVATDGSVAVATGAFDANGRSAPVIAWLTRSGELVRMVTTAPFAPRHIAFAKDDSLWAAGREYDSAREDRPDYNVIRHYDTNGRLAGSALSRSLFSPGKVGPANDSFLTVADTRIAMASVTAGEWVELDQTGRLLGRWPLSMPANSFPTGVALLANGDFIASFETTDLGRLFKYDRGQSKWEIVDSSQLQNRQQGLVVIGADGNSVVGRVKPPATLQWITFR